MVTYSLSAVSSGHWTVNTRQIFNSWIYFIHEFLERHLLVREGGKFQFSMRELSCRSNTKEAGSPVCGLKEWKRLQAAFDVLYNGNCIDRKIGQLESLVADHTHASTIFFITAVFCRKVSTYLLSNACISGQIYKWLDEPWYRSLGWSTEGICWDLSGRDNNPG